MYCWGQEALKLSNDRDHFPAIEAVVNGVVVFDDVIDKCVVAEIERL